LGSEKASSPTPETGVGGWLTAFNAEIALSNPYLPPLVVTEICSSALLGPSYSQLKIRLSTLLVFVLVNVVPVICEACVAGSAVHTSNFLPALDVPAFAVAADPPWPALDGAGAVAEAAFEPAEHAVADAATRIRLAAANTVGTFISSPVECAARRR
jgi:hypothetical protein